MQASAPEGRVTSRAVNQGNDLATVGSQAVRDDPLSNPEEGEPDKDKKSVHHERLKYANRGARKRHRGVLDRTECSEYFVC
jgi:hypothetical protein